MKLSLMVNDPQTGPASFTRFVLPFAYYLEEWKGQDAAGKFYRRAAATDWIQSGGENGPTALPAQERREYLTPETTRVLFSRAEWMVLNEADEVPDKGLTTLKVPLRSGTVSVQIRPAAVVLMEWEREVQRLEHAGDNHPSLLASGFIVLETWFADGSAAKLDDLLLWNELARYFRCPWQGHEKNDIMKGMGITKPADYVERWARLLEYPIKDPSGRLLRLMPNRWLERVDVLAQGGRLEDEALPHWMVHADNRCHVWTCAIHEDENLKGMCVSFGEAQDGEVKNGQRKECGAKNAQTEEGNANEHEQMRADKAGITPWLRLLNIDKPSGTDPASSFEQRWLADHTYTRWAESGTLYGFTSHSGAMLTMHKKEMNTWQHFRSLYFDQLLLMLYVRTSLFRFSEQLSRMACDAGQILALPDHSSQKKAGLEVLARDFRNLRWEFAQLTNLYLFPQISHQQQALEMYAMLRKQMVVEEFFQNVRTEIETTQTLLADHVALRQTHATLQLTNLAFLGLLLSLAVSALGVDAIKGLISGKPTGAVVLLFALAVIISYALLTLLRWLFDRPSMKRIIHKCLKLDF